MLQFYQGQYFTVSMRIEVVDPSLFKDEFKKGDVLFSQRIGYDEFRKIFGKDIWNCITYVNIYDSKIDELSTYNFVLNIEPIAKELSYVIAKNFLLDSNPSDKISISAKYYSKSMMYKLDYNGKTACSVNITLSSEDFIKSNGRVLCNRVLCVRSHYKDKTNIDSLVIYNLNKIIDEINNGKNIYSVEKDYGYRIENLDTKVAYQVILDPNKFNEGLVL